MSNHTFIRDEFELEIEIELVELTSVSSYSNFVVIYVGIHTKNLITLLYNSAGVNYFLFMRPEKSFVLFSEVELSAIVSVFKAYSSPNCY
jgi:hypothetical protein